MRTRRLGRIFSAEQGPSWMVSHAAYPTPLLIAPDQLRIYFNTRDADNRGYLAWIDVDPADPLLVRDISSEPSLGPGPIGTFDHRGISNGSFHQVGSELWLYYMGWNKAVDTPFHNSIGLAVCRNRQDAVFERRFNGPLLERSRFDPYTLSYPFVVGPSTGSIWQMYYGTSRAAGNFNDNFMHVIAEATSADGIDWRPMGQDVISLGSGELGLSRPWLIETKSGRVMLYSVRRAQYTIGAALFDENEGGWHRTTDDLLGPSTEDWDREASCYAAVIDVADTRLMFYCGNGYGRTGFGLAMIED